MVQLCQLLLLPTPQQHPQLMTMQKTGLILGVALQCGEGSIQMIDVNCARIFLFGYTITKLIYLWNLTKKKILFMISISWERQWKKKFLSSFNVWLFWKYEINIFLLSLINLNMHMKSLKNPTKIVRFWRLLKHQ